MFNIKYKTYGWVAVIDIGLGDYICYIVRIFFYFGPYITKQNSDFFTSLGRPSG